MALNGRFNRRRDARSDGEAQPLGARAANALGWNVFNALATRLGTMAIGIALARILGPEEFGTFAVATVMLLAVLSFNELGVSLAIVRWSGSPHEIAPTVATLATAASAVLALAAFVAAPAFCAAMGAPAATDVVRVLALTIVISGIVAGPAALLQRDFRARTRALIDQAGTWTGSSVAIGTAIGGMGAMSLATGRLAATSVTLVLFLRAAPIRFGFDRSVARRLLSFGLPLAGSSIVFFAAAYADQLIVGAVLGPVALGFYVLAFNLSSWPQTVFSLPVRNVSPAAFARLRDRPAILNDSFVRSVGLLTAIAFPICLALSGAAVPLIDVVYGDVWRTAAGALIWLGIVAALRILFEIAYDFLVVLGKTRQVFAIQIGSLAGSVPAVYAGAEIAGIAGAGAALIAVGMCITLPGYLFYLKRSGVSISQLGSTLVAPVIAAVAVAGAAFAADYLIAFDLLAVGVTGLAGLAMFALRYRSIRTQIKELGDRMSTEEEAGTAAAAPPRMPVSIVCVANDPAVREHCLDRSIAALRHEAPETEYVPIDNTGSKYDSAGAALNEGARRARHDYVVFVHQDVFLHSLRALEESAGALANDPSIGILGAYGSTETGHAVGQIRDRVLLLGEPPSEPSDVESLDEVLFMIPRERVLREPLSEDAELAWHAYAVDYGLRMRAQGMKVLATNIPLTHNSLTVNLARLDVAHRAVAKRHPWALPVHTTCGTITATTEGAHKPPSPLGRHRWRYRWLKESLMAHRARRAVGGAVVLSDVRHDVDDLLQAHSGMLRIINLELAPGPERNPHADQIKLQRLGRQITVESMTFPELTEAAANWRDGGSMLMTNLSLADLRALAGRLPAGCRRLVGCHDGHGFWLLLCRGDAAAAAIWERRRATPLGMEPVTVAAVALTDSPRPDGARA
jgi:O-antigen/teichoic acid export membrane protein